jgi:hypothetical protein
MPPPKENQSVKERERIKEQRIVAGMTSSRRRNTGPPGSTSRVCSNHQRIHPPPRLKIKSLRTNTINDAQSMEKKERSDQWMGWRTKVRNYISVVQPACEPTPNRASINK